MKTYHNIKALRELRGLSQEALAAMVGYKDRSSIAKIEAGEVDLSQSKIEAFAAALGATPAYLMGLKDAPDMQGSAPCVKHIDKSEPSTMTLKDLVVSYLDAHNLSQREFAQLCGISNSSISLLIKGTNPKTGEPIKQTLDTLKKLAAGMGLTFYQLAIQAEDLDIDLALDQIPGIQPSSDFCNVSHSSHGDIHIAFSNVLKSLRLQDKLTQSELAQKIGVSKSTISMYECGKREPDFEIIDVLTDFFNVDMDFLIGKRSQELIMNNLKRLRIERKLSMTKVARDLGIPYTTYVNYEKGDREPNWEMLIRMADYFDTSVDYLIGRRYPHTGIHPLPNFHKVPRLGVIACGDPILAEENIEGYDDVPDYIHADFTLVCHGDSMIGARIHDGDIVCVRQQPSVDNGSIAAVLIDEEATLKRVFVYKDHVVLQPENPDYKPLSLWEEDMNRVRILGLATHFISAVK